MKERLQRLACLIWSFEDVRNAFPLCIHAFQIVIEIGKIFKSDMFAKIIW